MAGSEANIQPTAPTDCFALIVAVRIRATVPPERSFTGGYPLAGLSGERNGGFQAPGQNKPPLQRLPGIHRMSAAKRNPPTGMRHDRIGSGALTHPLQVFCRRNPLTENGLSRGELLEKLRASRGMGHNNRSHTRTFSLNIFQMNAQELIDIASRINDPDEGLRLMSQANPEAGQQTHREITRRVHNFVASAFTLVEHTRNFMREHYADTPVKAGYQDRLDNEFKSDPLANFVKDLRNFILHKGLPESEMYMHFQSNPNSPNGGGELTTGIRINSSKLLEWGKWSPPARSFIQGSGQFVDIRTFAEAYTYKIEDFQEWLQAELDEFHAKDLEEMRSIQIELGEHISLLHQTVLEAPPKYVENSDDKYAFDSDRSSALNAAADVLLSKIRKIDLADQSEFAYRGERPVTGTITDQDMVEEPMLWGIDTVGRRTFAFIYKDNSVYGLDENVFAEIQMIVEGVLQYDWAKKVLSRQFIEKIAVKWLKSTFKEVETKPFSEIMITESEKAVQPLELWAPIAFLELQSPFLLGPVEIVSISKTKIDGLEAEALASPRAPRENVSQVFNQIRTQMQGLAAVVYRMQAEPKRIEEEGDAIARIVVGLMRFFSPAAANFPAVCANAVLGSEIVPISNIMILGDGTFSYSQALLIPNVPVWQLPDTALREMQPAFMAIGKLVRPDGLSQFALSVRSSVMLFGTGSTFTNPIERLTYSLSAVEAVLLQHSAEAVEFKIAQRMSWLIAQSGVRQEYVVSKVREAYRLRARCDIAPLTPSEEGSMAVFLRYAYHVVNIALGNTDRFGTVSEFVASIDQSKRQEAKAQ